MSAHHDHDHDHDHGTSCAQHAHGHHHAPPTDFGKSFAWAIALNSLFVAIVVAGTWGLLRESLGLALGAVPPHVNARAVETYLASLPGVTSIHDLHIWGMSTTESALTVHLVTPAGYPGDAFMDHAVHGLFHA